MMKKLYENIDQINIRGGVGQLSEMVTAMDISLQNISDSTNKLATVLDRYGMSNKGHQFERLVNSTMELRDRLFEASVELNDMQNQIVEYQNKIYRYEELPESAQHKNPHLVNKDKYIRAESSVLQFDRNEMIQIIAMLKNYGQTVSHHVRNLQIKKNSMASVWQDRQYNDFAFFIDNIVKEIQKAFKEFGDFINYLEERIKELN